ncbi:flotillin family protein [Prosthecobacter fluviatilis]|uniref:Flotillin family protein n=1 Tax=Prosthecobacter fluviatilis TaxID=445931 RepID=A0ABW0KWY0_9BACT
MTSSPHLAVLLEGSLLVGVIIIGIFLGILILFSRFFRKVQQGQAIVRNGIGGTKVSFNGMIVIPVAHQAEYMDISVKRIEIERKAQEGLICKDNLRADIKVAFFVRVNKTPEDVLRVAQSIGCARASTVDTIRVLFDAKFSEALKTVGKRFDFVQLYNERDHFKSEILKVIGTDLNGFTLDDCAIDFLEQTQLENLDPDNILDAEGIKKITELTAAQAKLSNNIQRDKEKVIKQQDVQAREAILELERQLAETESKQKRDVESVRARETAEMMKVQEEERLKAERAKISADEEIAIATQNKERQVLVAQRNKERTDAVEVERVTRDRNLEIIDRERITTLKSIEKDKAVEVEKKNIQEVIKDRVALEKTVVVEQQKMKDTEAFATADREKQVALTNAEKNAQEQLIQKIKEAEAAKQAAQLAAEQAAFTAIKAAEAAKQAAELHAQELLTLAEARQESAAKEAAAEKALAEGRTASSAAIGLGEAQVLLAKAEASQKQGTADAEVTQRKGAAEAEVTQLKLAAEADGITKKAQAMKLLENAGREHEEFKLTLDKEKAIELAQINIQKDIAAAQANVLGEAMKSAKIEIIGGESQFFDKITTAIGNARAIDRMVEGSRTLKDVKETFFTGDPDYFKSQLKNIIDQFGLTSEDTKNLTLSALFSKLIGLNPDAATLNKLTGMVGAASRFGLTEQTVSSLLAAKAAKK